MRFGASCSVSNALVAAQMAVVCTDRVLYAKALAAFWHVHAALEAAVAKHADHEGALLSCFNGVSSPKLVIVLVK